MPSIHLLPSAISEMFVQVTTTGKLTQADRYGLLAALLDDALEDDDRRAINRLLHALRQGRIQVVNDISTVL